MKYDLWQKTQLKNVFTVVKDKFNPETDTEITNYIGLENMATNKGVISKSNSTNVKSVKTRFKKNDVLYGKLRPYLNKHDIAKFSGICSTDILVYRAEDFNTAKFINYFMNTEKFIFYTV